MCHTRHARHARPDRRDRRSTREPSWEAPPERPAGPVRAGDADRERAAEALRTHAGAGRLDADELERRLETVLTATYLSELDAALADLPRLRAGERPRTGRGQRPGGPASRAGGPGLSRVAALLTAFAVLLVVTMLTGLWALWWLMWPIAMLTHGRGHGRRHGRPSSRAASV
jgi:hypothetical protein